MTFKLFYGNLIFCNNIYHLIKFKIRITYITLIIYWIGTYNKKELKEELKNFQWT